MNVVMFGVETNRHRRDSKVGNERNQVTERKNVRKSKFFWIDTGTFFERIGSAIGTSECRRPRRRFHSPLARTIAVSTTNNAGWSRPTLECRRPRRRFQSPSSAHAPSPPTITLAGRGPLWSVGAHGAAFNRPSRAQSPSPPPIAPAGRGPLWSVGAHGAAFNRPPAHHRRPHHQ